MRNMTYVCRDTSTTRMYKVCAILVILVVIMLQTSVYYDVNAAKKFIWIWCMRWRRKGGWDQIAWLVYMDTNRILLLRCFAHIHICLLLHLSKFRDTVNVYTYCTGVEMKNFYSNNLISHLVGMVLVLNIRYNFLLLQSVSKLCTIYVLHGTRVSTHHFSDDVKNNKHQALQSFSWIFFFIATPKAITIHNIYSFLLQVFSVFNVDLRLNVVTAVCA